MKLVLILVLMIVSVMAVVGTFLINSVSTFYIDSFYTQMQSVFTTDTIRSMQEAAAAPDAEGLKTIIDAHRSRLGIDDYRNYYILDGEGRFVDGSNPNLSVTRTRNIIAAMAGEAGTRSSVSDSVMDIAVPLDHDGNGTVDYIVYIADDKQEISDLSWRFFQIVMQAMMFGLLAAILLSFLLSKTITTPIERITEGARSIAEGNFDQDLGVQSSDEIGELTQDNGRRGAGRARQAEHPVPAHDRRRCGLHDRRTPHPYEPGDRKSPRCADAGQPHGRRDVRGSGDGRLG